jgi:hypothetical protein
MREVSVFYSFDDREFFDRAECEAYEREAMQHLRTVWACYAFYGRDGRRMFAPLTSNNIEDWMVWLCTVGDMADRILIIRQLPQDTVDFLRYQVGYCILPEDFDYLTGDFQYNWKRCEWVKVDE